MWRQNWGAIGGVEDELDVDLDKARLADPDKAVEFVEKSGIDALAPAIGTAHGLYKGNPKLDFARLEDISRKILLPVVLHGGTGLERKTFCQLINCGAAKINISTQIKIAYIDALKAYIEEKPTEYNPLKLIKYARERVTTAVKEFIDWFGSRDKGI